MSRSFLLAALVLAAIHVALTHHFVPLSAVFSEAPLTGDDYDLHIGQIFRVVEGLERWGHSWIYDVQLLAGQPEGTITDSGSKAWELWTFALTRLGVSRGVAFNSFVLLGMLSCPVLLFVAARLFRCDRWTSFAAAAMASSLWFFDSNLHWMWFIGMISWAFAASVSTVTLGSFWRFLEQPKVAGVVVTSVVLGLNLLIHPYTFFALAPPMAALYLHARKRLPKRAHLGTLAMVLSALALNAFWLLNAVRHWHYILNSAYYAQARPQHVLCDFAELLCDATDTGVIGTRSGFRFLYLALAVAGIWLLKRRNDSRWFAFAVGLGAGYAFAYLSNFIPGMQQTQPYRQVVAATLLSVIPAALFAGTLAGERAARAWSLGTRLLFGAMALMLGQFLTGDVLYFMPQLVREPPPLLDGSPTHISTYGYPRAGDLPSALHYGVPHAAVYEPGIDETLNWIATHIPEHARVLVQGNLLGERLAWHGRQEVLGGFLERNVAHVAANYFRFKTIAHDDADTLSRHLHLYAHGYGDADALTQHLRSYAVEWVIGNRPEFEAAKELLEPAAIVGGNHIYRTRLPVDRVLAGGGTVAASSNRIEVRGSDPNRATVLSYHWHEALRCGPNCRVERALTPIDPVGMLHVPAPHPANFTIWNSYQTF